MNRPFLLYQIEILRLAGITDITLSLSYQPDKIELVLGDGSEYGVDLHYITEPNPLGTGGAYKFVGETRRETMIVFNGDILTNLDISELLKFHASKNADATIALADVDDPSRFGLVEIDNENRVQKFTEKPKSKDFSPINTINAGIYVLEPSILDVIPPDINRSFEYDIFPDILARKLQFFGHLTKNSYWLDIGTPSNYLKAHQDFLNGTISGFEISSSARSDVATHAEIDRNSVVGDECTIKPGARVTNSVIGTGVHIEEKAVIENSVIWPHTRIAAAAEVRGAVVGRSCHIGRNALVREGAVLGDKTTLTDYTRA